MTAAATACIVGIGETQYTRWGGISDRSELSLACEAITAACQDAGLDVGRIDGVASYAYDSNDPWLLEESLGFEQLRFKGMVWGGGGGGSYAAIAQAVAAIQSGQSNYVAVFRSLCQGGGHRYGRGYEVPHGRNFLTPFGMLSPPLMLAPLAQRYKYEFGITPEQFGEVALVCRDNASRNPRAVLGGRPLTMEAYLNSRMIADPLRLFDCCQENDGACALIVTSVERARDLRRQPVRILAAGQGSEPGWSSGGLGSHSMPEASYAAGAGKRLAERLYGQAGITPDDVDTVQIYDHFTPFVLMALEAFGFCGRGEGGQFVSEGHIRWPRGRLPLNTSGGHLSEAYIHGLNLAVEGVRQLRGESNSQVAGAKICVVTCGVSAAILGA
jgi:acetyl-CoA acetyltransferase